MGRALLTLSFVLAAAAVASAQVPPFTAEDISATGGTTAFDNLNGRWTIHAEGADIWNNADQFRFTHIALTGDGEVVARVVSLAPSGGAALDAWAKAGVMIRQSNAAGSVHAFMAVTNSNGACFQSRNALDGASANTGNTGGAFVANRWVRLVREGANFRGYYRDDATATWTQIGGDIPITMTDPVRVGLALTSHSDGNYADAVFDNLRITQNGTVIYEWQPPVPTGLDAVGGEFRIDVNWDPVPGATSYTLERAQGAGAFDTSFGVAGTTYTDSAVVVDVSYTYRVRAVFGTATSGPSNVDSATAFQPAPRTEDNEEGFLDGDCACGASAAPFAPLGAALAGLALALLRRRKA